MDKAFAIIGNLLIIVVLLTYFKQVKNNHSEPNPSTWFLWTIIGIMNATSYFLVVKGNLWQSFITIISASGLSATFLYSAIRGKFTKFGKIDLSCFILALIIGIIWKSTGNADLANLSIQIIYVISFMPTIIGILNGKKEKAMAWNLAIIAYSFMLASIITSKDYRWQALTYPIINGIFGNGSVSLAILFQKRKKLPFLP